MKLSPVWLLPPLFAVCAGATRLRANPILSADPASNEAMFSQQESEFDGFSAGTVCPRPPCMSLRRSAAKRLIRWWHPGTPLLGQPWPSALVPPLPIIPPTNAKDINEPHSETEQGELVTSR